MGLWGTTHDATTNKPKYLVDSENSDITEQIVMQHNLVG